ncbi:hypothetical protein SAY86_014338 [Trapa natans]|uniref:Uncharacterized protein n=1 Tax=Trapa natans TaxID=22666 RepID=A0AAN7QQS7_TRANT|nr:hypothetical protein SAY86_014338 [Trapa natans]
MSLDDIIKNNKKSGSGNPRARGRGSGGPGPGPARRFQNRAANRPGPYTNAKVSSRSNRSCQPPISETKYKSPSHCNDFRTVGGGLSVFDRFELRSVKLKKFLVVWGLGARDDVAA